MAPAPLRPRAPPRLLLAAALRLAGPVLSATRAPSSSFASSPCARTPRRGLVPYPLRPALPPRLRPSSLPPAPRVGAPLVSPHQAASTPDAVGAPCVPRPPVGRPQLRQCPCSRWSKWSPVTVFRPWPSRAAVLEVTAGASTPPADVAGLGPPPGSLTRGPQGPDRPIDPVHHVDWTGPCN
nr:proline-rich receptor-like protein kinase PERK2 [Aegilops tauschii subsp. strangulata]